MRILLGHCGNELPCAEWKQRFNYVAWKEKLQLVKSVVSAQRARPVARGDHRKWKTSKEHTE